MSKIIAQYQNRWVNGINRDNLVRDPVRLTR